MDPPLLSCSCLVSSPTKSYYPLQEAILESWLVLVRRHTMAVNTVTRVWLCILVYCRAGPRDHVCIAYHRITIIGSYNIQIHKCGALSLHHDSQVSTILLYPSIHAYGSPVPLMNIPIKADLSCSSAGVRIYPWLLVGQELDPCRHIYRYSINGSPNIPM